MKHISIKQFSTYLAVGGLVGIITVAVREGFGLIIQDNASNYLISVLLAYALGIALSYCLHKFFTFSSTLKQNQNNRFNFICFTAIAIGSLMLTGLFSMLFRYGLHLDLWSPHYAAMIAFIGASLITSVVSYCLNATFSIRIR